MITAIALALALLQPQDPLLSKVVEKPTGQNGYEEYVQAAIIVDKPENKALMSYVRSQVEPASDGSKAPLRPESVPEGLKPLELMRLEVKKLQPVIDLIRAGNLKTVSYPKAQITPATLFPELSKFKIEARLIQHAAYVAFADGNAREGANLILDGLTFSEKIQVGGLVSLLVGRACTQMMYVAVDQNTPQIAVAGADKLRAWARGADVRFKDSALRAAIVERGTCRAFFDGYFTNPAEYFEGMDIKVEDQRKWAASLQAVPQARRDQIYGSIFKRLEAPMTALIARIRGPETNWLTPLDADKSVESDPIQLGQADDIGAPLMVLLRLYGRLGLEDFNPDFPVVLARCTIQDRLFQAHCDAIAFRWKTSKNPATLAELYGKEITDPLTHAAYDYATLDNGWFKISCKQPVIGEVTISNRGQAKGSSNSSS